MSDWYEGGDSERGEGLPLDGVLQSFTIRRDAKVGPSVQRITKERACEIAIETYGRDAARIPAYVNAAPVA